MVKCKYKIHLLHPDSEASSDGTVSVSDTVSFIKRKRREGEVIRIRPLIPLMLNIICERSDGCAIRRIEMEI